MKRFFHTKSRDHMLADLNSGEHHMIPVAGSAYTYAYATLGELFAWVIGLVIYGTYGIHHSRLRQKRAEESD